MSKAKPFRDVSTGDLFRDIDGTLFIKTKQKVYLNADGSDIANCMILIPNKQKDDRGDMRKKENDTYCEVLDITEVGEIHLIDDAKIVQEESP
jgi:hypothetical protein